MKKELDKTGKLDILDFTDAVYEANNFCDDAYALLECFIVGNEFDMRKEHEVRLLGEEWHNMTCVLYTIKDKVYESKQILNALMEKGLTVL